MSGYGEYGGIANALRDRIAALIPEHPEIMEMDSPWDLFDIEGFDCKDLAPSLYQAAWALANARAGQPLGKED